MFEEVCCSYLLGGLLIISCLAVWIHRTVLYHTGSNPVDNTVIYTPINVQTDKQTETTQHTTATHLPQNHHQRHHHHKQQQAVHESFLPVKDSLPADIPLIVVVLGWAGAKRRQLRRVLELYSDYLKVATISYISPMAKFVKIPTTIENDGKDFDVHTDKYAQYKEGIQLLDLLVEKLKELDANKPQTASKFMVHLHSNNGALCYSELLYLIHSIEKYRVYLLPKLHSVIFDSSPMLTKPPSTKPETLWDRLVLYVTLPYHLFIIGLKISFPIVAIILNKAQYMHIVYTPMTILWVVVYKGIEFILYEFKRLLTSPSSSYSKKQVSAEAEKIQSINQVTSKYNSLYIMRYMIYDRLTYLVPNIQHLFIYSDKDKLIPASGVERYADFVSATYPDTKVLKHKFDGSAHVAHLLKFPGEYAQVVSQFIRTNFKN